MEIPKIDNPTLYILIGVPGSGKSTYAEELYQKSERGIALVSSDQIRKSLYGNESCQDNPKKVFSIAHQATIDQLTRGYDVIFDATNIYAKDRMDLIRKVCFEVKKEVRFIAIYFDTPIETCIARQDLRERKVPTKVIEKMNRQMEKPVFYEGFDIIRTI